MKEKFNFGENLYRIRKPTGISQDAMALKLGINQRKFSRIERGVILPDQNFIDKAAVVLEVTPAELMSPGWDQRRESKVACSLTPTGKKAYALLLIAAVYDCTRGLSAGLGFKTPLMITAVAAFCIMAAVLFWDYTVKPVKVPPSEEKKEKKRYWFIEDVTASFTKSKDQIIGYLSSIRQNLLIFLKKCVSFARAKSAVK